MLMNSMALRESDSLAGMARMRVHRCSVMENLAAAYAQGVPPVANGWRVIVHHALHAQLPFGLMFQKSEKLAINKSSDGRSAVVLWPSFRRMLHGYS